MTEILCGNVEGYRRMNLHEHGKAAARDARSFPACETVAARESVGDSRQFNTRYVPGRAVSFLLDFARRSSHLLARDAFFARTLDLHERDAAKIYLTLNAGFSHNNSEIIVSLQINLFLFFFRIY